jgi:rsbT co-antagonist protein RsbR
MSSTNLLSKVLNDSKEELLKNWETHQLNVIRSDLTRPSELKSQIKDFYDLFLKAVSSGKLDLKNQEWNATKEFLSSLSYSRGVQGFTPSETAQFVLTLKKSITANEQLKGSKEIWEMNETLDNLALYTMEVYQKAREEVINRQQSDMLELSTPVVELADGIIALPMIGTLDSSRTSVVMETLLQRIVETSASIAIIDITGVPTVDTLVAQHLLKTVTAAKLMGAECIISGIRPQIAATIVHLGVDLGNVITKASLASAFHLALKKTGSAIVKNSVATKA